MLQQLREIVGEADVLSTPQLMASYSTDWTGTWTSAPLAVVRPHTTTQVSAVLRLASEAGIAVIPQGGNTGLVGGGVGGDREHIILSTRNLRSVSEFDTSNNQLTVSAGFTLVEVQDMAAAQGLEYPVDIAARDSATIGGTIATNAGGIRVVAHGMTSQHVRGVELVLSDGKIVDDLAALAKDNTGPKISRLAIASEGTLGVVTAVRLQLYPKRKAAWTVLVPLESLADAASICTPLLPQLLAAEIMRGNNLGFIAETIGLPILPAAAWWLLIEGDGDDGVLADLPAQSLVAMQASDVDRYWQYRERHTEVIAHRDNVLKLDTSVPVPALSAFISDLDALAAAHGIPSSDVFVFGHVMDGNLHVAIADCPDIAAVSDAVMATVFALGGAISAEHGIGQAKTKYLPMIRSERELEVWRSVRRALDPAGVMNPDIL